MMDVTARAALLAQATRWAAIRHASSAWGTDEEGHMVDRLLGLIDEQEERIKQLEGRK
jgi:hypothetical protein